jgi:hypothetical protein|nr:MAG TPA: hypothetical protein [Caudoviricetes sp.]DAN28714.1 MAG TPA: hypothetical protein [Caudoviricetes sp.]DAP19860.1 MAG TPA: hypothetical protein [Caudoviricetes sp.]DAS21900.1 MAG TPA: hypothetical protein [Caudoviricetes sp.]DAT08309.1 MAG TPA: hypothetical protein [Caudoviricetes sp.]
MMGVDDFICHYAFFFGLGVDLVMTFPIHDVVEMGLTKVTIDAWKNSE